MKEANIMGEKPMKGKSRVFFPCHEAIVGYPVYCLFRPQLSICTLWISATLRMPRGRKRKVV